MVHLPSSIGGRKINGSVSKHVLNIAWKLYGLFQQIIASGFQASVNKVKFNFGTMV